MNDPLTTDTRHARSGPEGAGEVAQPYAPGRRRRPELLAPAGDWDCARAAVENGADAIYFGLERFNARMRAHNFTTADLPALMEFLHRRGVRGYVTFNTLIFQNELAEAAECLRSILAAGVDAAIVQDVGICRLIRSLSPDFPIHASTQMTVTSAAGVEFARELGCQLVVVARECSIRELEILSRTTSSGASETVPPLPLEVFVHGALCVAYSGQCLTSEALGGRSANRGECAQACRMPYELIRDGQIVPLGDRRYLLSPQDLAGLELVPDLAGAGVASLKIEGRLKSPEYVANITRIYRQAIDRLDTENPPHADAPQSEGSAPVGSDTYDMEMAFSRGLSTGWLGGIDNQKLVHARFGKKRGVYLGRITAVRHDHVVTRLEAPLRPGDGVVFDAGHPESPEQGGRVYEIDAVRPRGKTSRSHPAPPPAPAVSPSEDASEVELRFGRGDVDFGRVQTGDRLWKTSDPELDRRLRQTFAGTQVRFQRPVRMEIHGRAGEPMTLIVHDEEGHVVRATSAQPLVPAGNQPLTEARLRGQLGRLGGTPFRLQHLGLHLQGDVILPVSELNRLRRDAVAELEHRRAQPRRWTLNARAADPATASPIPGEDQRSVPVSTTAAAVPEEASRASSLLVLVRNMAQLEAALRCGAETLYCDFEDVKKYREAVRLVREAARCAGPERTIWLAPPRIFKTGEDWILKQVRAAEPDGYLVRNYDHLRGFSDCRKIGDFSLNVANALTADYFKNRFGLERVTASYDLNSTQLEALLQAAPPSWFEVTIHQHMPMFHMEHCVFCAFLSSGTDYTNCGRPCDRHEVRLRDRVGAEHVLKADAGCRNTVFNAMAQTGAELVERLRALGARHFRIEFAGESPEQVVQVLTKYRQLLRGEISGAQLWRELKLVNQVGVTRGTLDKP